jgi:hypothetical protein
MNTRSLKLLTALAAALLAFRAFAHEVDCEKTVGVVQVDGQGNPVLGQDGLPMFVGGTATSIVIDHFPAVVGFRIRVNNLATETSIIDAFSDPLVDASTSAYGTLPSPGLGIPVGGSTDAIVLRRIGSLEECTGAMTPDIAAVIAALPPGEPLGGPVCRDGLVNVATVVTESNIAECRAKVICKPPPP